MHVKGYMKRVRPGSDYWVPTGKKIKKMSASTKKDVKKEIAKQILNASEKKWIYTEPWGTPQPIYNAGTGLITLMNGTQQGTGGTNRIGRDFSIKKIEVHGSLEPLFANGVSVCLAHEATVAVVYDKSPKGVLPTTAEIFNWDAGSEVRRVYGIINPLYVDRFKLIWKKTIKIPNFDSTLVTGQTQYPFHYWPFHWKKKYKKGLKVMCANQSVGDITDISMGALYFIAAVSERTINADVKATYVYVDTKVVFTDS